MKVVLLAYSADTKCKLNIVHTYQSSLEITISNIDKSIPRAEVNGVLILKVIVQSAAGYNCIASHVTGYFCQFSIEHTLN